MVKTSDVSIQNSRTAEDTSRFGMFRKYSFMIYVLFFNPQGSDSPWGLKERLTSQLIMMLIMMNYVQWYIQQNISYFSAVLNDSLCITILRHTNLYSAPPPSKLQDRISLIQYSFGFKCSDKRVSTTEFSFLCFYLARKYIAFQTTSWDIKTGFCTVNGMKKSIFIKIKNIIYRGNLFEIMLSDWQRCKNVMKLGIRMGSICES